MQRSLNNSQFANQHGCSPYQHWRRAVQFTHQLFASFSVYEKSVCASVVLMLSHPTLGNNTCLLFSLITVVNLNNFCCLSVDLHASCYWWILYNRVFTFQPIWPAELATNLGQYSGTLSLEELQLTAQKFSSSSAEAACPEIQTLWSGYRNTRATAMGVREKKNQWETGFLSQMLNQALQQFCTDWRIPKVNTAIKTAVLKWRLENEKTFSYFSLLKYSHLLIKTANPRATLLGRKDTFSHFMDSLTVSQRTVCHSKQFTWRIFFSCFCF